MLSAPTDPQPAAPTLGSTAEAGLLRRWCALAYEALLLAALLLVAGFAVLPLVGMPGTGQPRAATDLYVLPAGSRAFLFVFYVAVAGIYFTRFWTKGRRTLPMKTWGLGLLGPSESPLGSRVAIIRYFAGWIGPLTGLAGYALWGRWGLLAGLLNYYWAWLDPDRRFLHDRIAGTRIVRR